ncbi:disintegrin and metalloproteinase domain-containing protein 9-like [Ambystoma mexicanum]|uniref:disintegrin and metalloproteinase domain-containing protein 9-like n=1 Tax=Ambystoma mexicanum TaxID=8296 RepID=UPI0037E8CBBE
MTSGPLLLRALGLLCAQLLQGALLSHLPDVYEVIIPRRLENVPGPGLAYQVTAGGRIYTLHLLHNSALLAPGFAVYTQNGTGRVQVYAAPRLQHCYYYGNVEGIPGSMVSLSTCAGVRGFLQTKSATYAIEPVKDAFKFQHIIYKVENDGELTACQVVRQFRTAKEELLSTIKQRKYRQSANSGHAMHIYVIVDHDLFLYYSENITLVTDVVLHVMNMADTMFAPLHLQLVLSGLQIWNVKSVIQYNDTAHNVLRDLATWKAKRVHPGLKVDMTVLLRKDMADELVSGATFAGDICWGPNAVMFVSVRGDRFHAIASNVAHELGHAFGMPHDPDYTSKCPCPLSPCIMSHGGVTATSFSVCSMQYYSRFIARGGGYCLQAVPSAHFRRQETFHYCGNKKVEGQEQCDCGSEEECASDPCCTATCKLKGNAQCSNGECCRWCQFIDQGTPCRKPVSECDLAEYCNGTSSFCPDDMYSQDGTPCNRNQSFCVSNKCYDYNQHCEMLFGKGAKAASRECFAAINTIGDNVGNCGFEDRDGSPKKCEPADVLCGRVHCYTLHNINIYKSHAASVKTSSGNTSCLSIDYPYSITDVGEVEDGAQCGIGKICLARKCVNISDLTYDCDVLRNCSGHGVCNNNKHCHCNNGWAPPNCKYGGHGGSIDSGPLILGSFVRYSPPEEEFQIREYVCPLVAAQREKERQEKLNRDLAIGLGVTIPLVVAAVILGIVFRHQIVNLFKR